jgi:homoserine O-succinyltransferase/O-acetyltransferase
LIEGGWCFAARPGEKMQTLSPQPRLRGSALSRDDTPIVIGLVNNMPDAALRTTERQFRELLSAAADGSAVSLRLFFMPEVPRAEAGRLHIAKHYDDIRTLWSRRIDGLIVTGNEPRTPSLADEPYWPALTRLVDWAAERTISTVWSCLAAHAAVLHLDGVDRRALGEKLFGVFECSRVADHPIVAGTPLRWQVPHSRYNELAEDDLRSHGYRLLTRSAAAGSDMFVKQTKSLFLFLQGHPEYDRGALLREYRRDVTRYLAGERDAYPEMPQSYVDEEAAVAFAAFRGRAMRDRRTDLIAHFPGAIAERGLAHSWRSPAVRLYANWLSYLAGRRSPGGSPVEVPGLASERLLPMS